MPHFFLFRLAIGLNATEVARQFVPQLFHIVKLSRCLRLVDLILEKHLSPGPLGPGSRLDIRQLHFLRLGQPGRGCFFLQTLHREFVGAFHKLRIVRCVSRIEN